MDYRLGASVVTEPADDEEDDGLSEYERRFVEAYMGEAGANGARAAMLVGSTTPHAATVTATRVLRRPHVRRAIRERADGDPLVASRVERLRFLTAVMRGEVSRSGKRKGFDRPSMRERIDAVQVLSKICGDFLPEPLALGEDNKAAGLTIERLFALMQTGAVQ
jgi:hypothetical protein